MTFLNILILSLSVIAIVLFCMVGLGIYKMLKENNTQQGSIIKDLDYVTYNSDKNRSFNYKFYKQQLKQEKTVKWSNIEKLYTA